MSADNYYVIRKHPDGGFAAVMGFSSDDETPVVRPQRHISFPTVEEAMDSVAHEYAEYGTYTHSEVDE